MAIQFSGISNLQPIQQAKTAVKSQAMPNLQMGKDTVSFGNAATETVKAAEEVVKSKPVREFISKMLKPVGQLLLKCKDGIMASLGAVAKVIAWPFKAIAGLLGKNSAAVKEGVEAAAKAAS
ncbi:MAG: hypothetical protein AB7V50_07445 [Vampirovibrionia bacterium]